jgi:hypothetical protein
MRGEGARDAIVVIGGAQGFQRARFDFGRQMAFLQREQAAAVKDDIGVGDATIGRRRCRRARQFLTETAEQRAAGIVLGLPFRRADPAITS